MCRGHRKLSEVLWVVLRKSDKQGLISKRKKEENIVALFPLGFMFLADGQGEHRIFAENNLTRVWRQFPRECRGACR